MKKILKSCLIVFSKKKMRDKMTDKYIERVNRERDDPLYREDTMGAYIHKRMIEERKLREKHEKEREMLRELKKQKKKEKKEMKKRKK